MKKGIKVLLVFVAIATILLIAFLVMYSQMNNDLANLKFPETNLENLANGTYKGEAETSLVKVEVAVQVNDHKITRIDLLKHDNGRGAMAEAIVDEMINQNTCNVDVISGATASSQVIKSAVSKALASGNVF
jgi:uncharacterized protein with FMN-binding domain